MKIANSLRYQTLIFVALAGMTLPAWGLDNYKEFKRDHMDVEAAANFFYSEANYDSSGTLQNLPNGNHFQVLDVNFNTRYVPTRTWSLFGWLNVGNAESKDSVSTRANSAPSDGAIGADFLLYSEKFQLVPEVALVIPFASIEPSSDDVANSEGATELRSRLVAQTELGALRPYGWLGFHYRSDGRSFLLPWGVGFQYKLSQIKLGAELFGFQSVTDDTSTSAGRTAYINSVQAGSLKFYGQNPSLMDATVFGTWNVTKKWALQANGGVTLLGSNSAAGYHVGGFIRYTFDFTEGYSQSDDYVPIESATPRGRSRVHDRSDSLSSEKVRQFREETDDGVDQNLFRPQPTRKPKINDQELRRQLDETEFNVELKSNKKKKRRK